MWAGSRTPVRGLRLGVLAVAVLSLLLGGWGGLQRAGWDWPPSTTSLATGHAVLLLVGFVTTLVASVRAIATLPRIALVAPVLAAAGALATLVDTLGLPGPFTWAHTVAGVSASLTGLALLILALVLRPPSTPLVATVVMALGATALAIAGGFTAIALSFPVAPFVAFVTLMIVGERLDLDRTLRPASTVAALWLAVGAAPTLAGAWMAEFSGQAIPLVGVGMLVLALYGLTFDGARSGLGAAATRRYQAVAIVAAYAWLAVAGILGIASDGTRGSAPYDAFVHAAFAGFVLTTIAAHVPIFVPGIAGIVLTYRRTWYVAVALLAAGAALRVALDLANDLGDAARWGGLITGLGVLALVVVTASSARRRRPI